MTSSNGILTWSFMNMSSNFPNCFPLQHLRKRDRRQVHFDRNGYLCLWTAWILIWNYFCQFIRVIHVLLIVEGTFSFTITSLSWDFWKLHSAIVIGLIIFPSSHFWSLWGNRISGTYSRIPGAKFDWQSADLLFYNINRLHPLFGIFLSITWLVYLKLLWQFIPVDFPGFI